MNVVRMMEHAVRAWNAWLPAASVNGRTVPKGERWAEALLGLGVFWSIAGVLLTPSMKFYYTTVVLFIYLPSLWLVIARRAELGRLVRARKELWLFFLLFAWASLSLLWSTGDFERLGALKEAALFVLLVCGWLLWGRGGEARLRGMLLVLALLNCLYSLAALVLAPSYDQGRLSGFGGFMDNPNAAAYTTALLLVLAIPLGPRRPWARLAWLVLQAVPLAYVVMCGSRGALLALMVAALSGVLLVPGLKSKLIALGLPVAGLVVLRLEPGLLARGDAERLELLHSSLPILREHFWTGVGYGTDYLVQGWAGNFHGNSHNFLLHTAIQYGIPALLAWLLLWAMLGLQAWRCRATRLGLAVLLLWVYSSVALQFDVFSLWERTRAMWLIPWVATLLCLCLERRPEQA